MKRILLTTLGILTLTLALGLAAAALVVATTQAQGVSTQGLPARYIPAFTGAGIDTAALLGPYCKSARAGGGILTITCEDDHDPTNPDAVTTFAGGGGGTDPRAVVGVTYEHTTKTFTFMQAGGATITCRTDAGLSSTGIPNHLRRNQRHHHFRCHGLHRSRHRLLGNRKPTVNDGVSLSRNRPEQHGLGAAGKPDINRHRSLL